MTRRSASRPNDVSLAGQRGSEVPRKGSGYFLCRQRHRARCDRVRAAALLEASVTPCQAQLAVALLERCKPASRITCMGEWDRLFCNATCEFSARSTVLLIIRIP
ncbi:MAG: hypothetical protein V9E98_09750, partial [Candidatus Nanopelagicales bacterium]